jgi:hypothetical protein
MHSRSSVHKQLAALGLRTYNSAHSHSRATFKYEPIIRLYKLEIPSLFGILCRDEGSILQREDPNLFDKELDKLLEEYGPLIWPKPGEGDRDHLLEARMGSPYEQDLVYPRDTVM